MSELEKLFGVLGQLGIPHIDEPQRIALEAPPDRVVLAFDQSGAFTHIRINDEVFQRGSAVGKLLLYSLRDS